LQGALAQAWVLDDVPVRQIQLDRQEPADEIDRLLALALADLAASFGFVCWNCVLLVIELGNLRARWRRRREKCVCTFEVFFHVEATMTNAIWLRRCVLAGIVALTTTGSAQELRRGDEEQAGNEESGPGENAARPVCWEEPGMSCCGYEGPGTPEICCWIDGTRYCG
jgi:hypothetical protein